MVYAFILPQESGFVPEFFIFFFDFYGFFSAKKRRGNISQNVKNFEMMGFFIDRSASVVYNSSINSNGAAFVKNAALLSLYGSQRRETVCQDRSRVFFLKEVFIMELYSSIDTLWVLLGAALVFFMQAGFCMVETGLAQGKNSGNIVMKNVMDLCMGTVIFWVFGFGLMFGASHFGLIGTPDFLVRGDYSGTYPTFAFLIFQTVFCATSATIVSGAMAERTKFSTYLIFSAVLSALIYPISGHWIWGGGWLAELGFHDFAGSTAVHMAGGVAALIGAAIVGPRIGKYSEDGKPNAIPGCNITLAALGVFILWFAWFGFNGASTVSMTGDDTLVSASKIFVNTNLSAAVAAIGAMTITWIKYKKPDVSMTLNGALAGLVGITAGCDMVTPVGAFCIGLISSVCVVFGIEFVDKVLHVDDPVGAVGVHGICGAVGTILTGVFAEESGLLYGGGFSFLGVQTLGVVVVILWVAVTCTAVFQLLKHTVGLRVSESEEITGLDLTEHGLVSETASFLPGRTNLAVTPELMAIADKSKEGEPAEADEAVEVIDRRVKKNADMHKITIITNENRFEYLKRNLEVIGVTGMTLTRVHGCGMQKGQAEYYRGVKVGMKLLPKIKVDIVVCKVPVEKVVGVAKLALFTGHYGDGKIFVYDVENVIKIRTGEEGYDALQDEADE